MRELNAEACASGNEDVAHSAVAYALGRVNIRVYGDRLMQAPFLGLCYLALDLHGFLPVGEKVRAYGERKDECRDCRC